MTLTRPPTRTRPRRRRSPTPRSSTSTTCSATCSTSPATARWRTISPGPRSRRPSGSGRTSTRAAARARTWLLGIARTTALDWFRAESRRQRREEAAAEPEAHEADFVEGLSPDLQLALATLSAGEREVLALRIVIELDGEQTARVLGISQTAVSTRLSRALQKLEEKVRNDDLR